MTVEREALERAVTSWWSAGTIMGLADAWGDARELKGHVKACEAVGGVFPKDNKAWQHCGDGWYCDRAPIKPVKAERS